MVPKRFQSQNFSLFLVKFKLGFNAPLILKNDVTEPRTRRLSYSNNQLKVVNKLKDSFRLSKTMVCVERIQDCIGSVAERVKAPFLRRPCDHDRVI